MNVSFHNNLNSSNVSVPKRRTQGRFTQKSDNVSFDGNIAATTGRFADKMIANPKMQKFLSGKVFNKFLKTSLENPGLYEALIALGITCSARPLTVLATPGAKMEDKQYASAQSIASGTVGLAAAYLMFDPITKALDDTLVRVNGKNLSKAFSDFYSNAQNAALIDELVKEQIIPDKNTFDNIINSGKDVYKEMKTFFIKNGQKARIDELLVSDDVAKADHWRALSSKFSKALNSAFQVVKNDGVSETKKYLVHSALNFQPELKYNIVNSKQAEKMKFILGYSSKFVIFPILAASTIWAIPKIMKTIFPNHRKVKNKQKSVSKAVSENKQNISVNMNNAKNIVENNPIFGNFTKPAVQNKQVSFSGGNVLKGLGVVYEKAYKNPLSAILNKFYSKVVYSKAFSRKMGELFQDDIVTKHGMEVLNRNLSGKILKKHDTNPFVSNLSDIIAIWGSCLYIFNTIRNKEIEKERKPALCTNLALVAIFSFFASKHIGKLVDPIFNSLQKAHVRLMNKKLNYDASAAWKGAQKILVTTFAFRYLGPVLATPAADKVVKLFNTAQNTESKK